MKRQMGILTAVLCAGLWMAALSPEGRMFAEAKEQNAEEKENLQVRELASRGNLVYRDGGEKAGIYAADFSLLFGKLSAVSGEVFDPAAYTHMHRWEYRNGDDRTHTKYCALCGAALTGVHLIWWMKPAIEADVFWTVRSIAWGMSLSRRNTMPFPVRRIRREHIT